ncbi:hypothetical protein BDV18DRAFT_81069 [Aspergillus unguis]
MPISASFASMLCVRFVLYRDDNTPDGGRESQIECRDPNKDSQARLPPMRSVQCSTSSKRIDELAEGKGSRAPGSANHRPESMGVVESKHATPTALLTCKNSLKPAPSLVDRPNFRLQCLRSALIIGPVPWLLSRFHTTLPPCCFRCWKYRLEAWCQLEDPSST